MVAYIGKVLVFMVLALPAPVVMRRLDYPDWSMFVVWTSIGVIGRETVGRKLDRLDQGDPAR